MPNSVTPPSAPPSYDPANPLIVQGDRTVLVEVDNPRYPEARDALAPFAELEKSPEHIHTYRLTSLSLWNAAAAGLTAPAMIEVLRKFSKFPLPANLLTDISEQVSRYGRVKMEKHDRGLRLVCPDAALLEELTRQPKVRQYLGEKLDASSYLVDPAFRGVLKQALIAVGYPAEDLAGYTEGAALPIHLRTVARSGLPFHVRDYQREAADVFYAGGDVRGGSGVIVLPCGAGKTIVGIAAMAKMQRSTLVLTTGITAVKQWHREILDRTDLAEDHIAEYTGESKDVAAVTLATYQILTYRNAAGRGRGARDERRQQDRRFFSRPSPRPSFNRPARLGSHHLRRGSPAAGAGVPGDGEHSGTAAAGADRDPHPRGRPRRRRLHAHRSKEI